jgi:hypothetical protein
MSKNTKSKYGELIIDIASKPSFRIDDMRQKHKVSTRVFTVMRSMQIIKKQGKEHVWVGEQPTPATINLITKQCRYSSRVEKVMAKQLPPSQLTIKPIKRVESPVPQSIIELNEKITEYPILDVAIAFLAGMVVAAFFTLIWKS